MSEHWGWRTTFIVVGLPGLLIALLVRFTLIEPPRGASEEAKQDRMDAPGLGEVWKIMLQTPATRHVVFGSALAGFVGYGMTLWLPAFFVRSHDLSQSETGLTLALMSGIVGGIGTFTAGRLADHLAKRDPRWLAWIVAVGKGGLVPFLVCFFWFTDLTSALLVYLIPAFFGGFYLAPTFAMVQQLVRCKCARLPRLFACSCSTLSEWVWGPKAWAYSATSLPPNMVSSRCVIRSWCSVW